jgi:hypothetical protein
VKSVAVSFATDGFDWFREPSMKIEQFISALRRSTVVKLNAIVEELVMFPSGGLLRMTAGKVVSTSRLRVAGLAGFPDRSVQFTVQVCGPVLSVSENEVIVLFSVVEFVWLGVPSIKSEQLIVPLRSSVAMKLKLTDVLLVKKPSGGAISETAGGVLSTSSRMAKTLAGLKSERLRVFAAVSGVLLSCVQPLALKFQRLNRFSL